MHKENLENKQKINCKLCDKLFSTNHLWKKHKDISPKQYYDIFLKKENEGKCQLCNKETKFKSINKGYKAKTCHSCSGKRSNKLKYKNWIYKKDKLLAITVTKICFKCQNEFKTYKGANYCSKKTCCRYNPKDKKQIEDVINNNDTSKCPYCNKNIKNMSILMHHLNSHFNQFQYPKFEKIYRHLMNVGYINVNSKCNSINCNNEATYIGFTNGFSSSCKECVYLFNNDKTQWIQKRFSIEEKQNIANKKAITIKNTHNKKINDLEKFQILLKQWEHVGAINSLKMKNYNKTEKGIETIKRNAKNNSLKMKEKIANGKFTPCITNSFTHWEAKIIVDNIILRFRSSWEACFWYCNQHLKYEKFRIPYLDINGKTRTYIPDFYDEENKIIYEIKPKCHYLTQAFKMDSIITYCLSNNIKFIWINENNLLNYIDENKFIDELNIKQLNKVKLGITQSKSRK